MTKPGHLVLDAMAEAPAGTVHLELHLATTTGLARKTVHRWLARMQELDLVRWRPVRPRPGWTLTGLGIRFHAALLDAIDSVHSNAAK